MRKMLLALTGIFCLAACEMPFAKRLTGSGVRVTDSRALSGFTDISCQGGFKLVLKQGSSFGVTITADDNLIPYLETERDGKLLTISVKEGYDFVNNDDVTVLVTMPELRELSVLGSATVSSEGAFAGTANLDISVTGSGSVGLQVDCPNVNADVSGSGAVTLRGKCRSSEVQVTGSGSLDADELLAETCNVSVTGSGDANVYASLSLDASVTGSGSIFYSGNATQVRKNVTGSGDIEPRNSKL